MHTCTQKSITTNHSDILKSLPKLLPETLGDAIELIPRIYDIVVAKPECVESIAER